jgi:hypothetical protein
LKGNGAHLIYRGQVRSLPNQEDYKMTTKTKTTFEAPEDFGKLTVSQANRIVGMYIAANPGATIYAVEGMWAEGLPMYIRKVTGKRADIHRMVGDAGAEGITFKAYLAKAIRLGGGYTDITAMLNGGFSPTANGYGKSTVRLTA